MGEFGMNCSMAKSFTPCGKPKLSSKDGGTITTPSDHTVHWATAHQRLQHRSNGPTANHALTFNLAQFALAMHSLMRYNGT